MADHADKSDSYYVKAILRGESSNYKYLMTRWGPALHAIARGCGVADVENAVQESFVRGYACLGTLKNPERFGAWIIRICRNVCSKSISRQIKDRDAAMVKKYMKESPEPELSVNGSLESAIEELEESHRDMIHMKFFVARKGGGECKIRISQVQ